ncbi:uncharacterized protein LOC125240925 [Leguminivora glycinivorella]|uniref:uncharacterized protein LOC125240925 n=1 Tax=Leguminivora glycinivorella TaxID=1035111 RepID=UPI00200E6E7A|nr:uncharacterized protein LOC125240925 [Leguminivora glycinivorella]
MDFVTSSKGKRLLRHSGYTYYREYVSSVGDRSLWRCSTHWSRGCRATVHTSADAIVRRKNKHNHTPSLTYTTYNRSPWKMSAEPKSGFVLSFYARQ